MKIFIHKQKLNQEEKEIIHVIEQALNYKNTKINTKCLSYKEIMSSQDYDSILKNLESYHSLLYNYISEFNDAEEKNNLNDFKLFNYQEREIILKLLSHQKKKKMNKMENK